MSHAAPQRFPAEHHGAELARLMAIPTVAERMARDPEVSFEFDVPDLGGYSTDGNTIYIDRDAHKQLDVRDVAAVVEHEHVEKTLIDALGYSYAAAHEMATTAEHQKVQEPKSYEKRLAPFIKRAEHEKITKPPPDLDCHPYYDHPDAQDLIILAHLARLGVKDAQHERQKLSHAAVAYGPGHAPEFCSKCEHYQFARKGAPHCELVADPIQQSGWCRLWKKK